MIFGRHVAISLLLVATLAGCGSEDPRAIEGRELRLQLDEYRITPQDVTVKPGRLRIVATNVGRLTHNVKVVRVDPRDHEAPVIEIDGTRTAQPLDTESVTVRLRPGEYRLACTIANHDDLGQYGRLIVEERE
jgi:plastocyanin